MKNTLATHLRALAVGATCAVAITAHADEAVVAVAANFAGPMAQIASGFKSATGHTLKVAAGSTGKLYSQVLAGAPFQVLLAADDETPKKLVAAGQAVSGSQFTYAVGKLVLWSAQAGLVDDQGAVLGSTRFGHLALANPKLAPYGRAAIDVLKSRGLADALRGRIVTGESIAQTYQFVLSGNAELGFVAYSQIVTPGQPVKGSHWVVPASLYGEIRQDAVLLKAGETSVAARALLDYLKRPEAQAVIRSFGYGI